MTESKGGLSLQAREFVAVGASVGAGCHPCVTHHLKAGTGVGLGAQALVAAIMAAERVTADSSARMAQHARRQLPEQTASRRDPPCYALCWVRRAEGPLRRARWTRAQGLPRCQAQGEVR